MIHWVEPDPVASPVEGEGVVMGRRMFGWGSRWHCWRIKRRIAKAGSVEALAGKFGRSRRTKRNTERIGA